MASSKSDSLQKQAADAFGPRLERAVTKGKDALAKRQIEAEKRLQNMKISLQKELTDKVEEAIAQTRESLKDEEIRIRNTTERELQRGLTRHGDEVSLMKERNQRERKLADEAAERVRRLESESTLDGLKQIRAAESVHTKELVARQQRELSSKVRDFSNGKENLRKQIEKNLSEWEEQCQFKIQAEVQASADEARALAKSNAFAETEEILKKLREEILQERRTKLKELEDGLESLQIRTEERMDSLRLDERRLGDQADSLNSEVDALKSHRGVLQSTSSSKSKFLCTQRAKLEELRSELKQVRGDIDGIDSMLDEETRRHRDEQEVEMSHWHAKIEETEEELVVTTRRIRSAKSSLQERLDNDISRIRNKIGAVLRSKDLAIQDLRRQLGELQSKNSHQQDQLEFYRDKKFSSV
jgi:hypothetical protein